MTTCRGCTLPREALLDAGRDIAEGEADDDEEEASKKTKAPNFIEMIDKLLAKLGEAPRAA